MRNWPVIVWTALAWVLCVGALVAIPVSIARAAAKGDLIGTLPPIFSGAFLIIAGVVIFIRHGRKKGEPTIQDEDDQLP